LRAFDLDPSDFDWTRSSGPATTRRTSRPAFPLFLWGIGLVLNAWDVYWHKPLSEDRIREEMERMQ
jgi:hypothetical protein